MSTDLLEKGKENLAKGKTKDKLLLIDGSNLAFRMFFALEMTNMRNSDGDPTWAIYGTFKAIFDMIEEIKPTGIAVAFDLPVPSFRHETFDDYKANRPDEMPDELKQQWGLIKDAFRYLHIPVLEEPGYEADDLIGIMAVKAENAGQDVAILSGDRDLFQLVNENVALATPVRGGGLKIYSPADVFDQMGVWPNQIVDYKGIAGDSSDNIPGIKGLGPKAATKLLGEYGDLENIYKNIDKIGPPGTHKKLVEQEENARLSKFLGTLILEEKDIKEADLTLEHCLLTLPDIDDLVGFFKRMEFNSFLRRLPVVLKPFNGGELVKFDVGELPEQEFKEFKKKEDKAKAKKTKIDGLKHEDVWGDFDAKLTDVVSKPFVVLDESTLNSVIAKLQAVDTYAIDLETTGLNTLNCEIVGWALAIKEKKTIKSFYIPILHQNVVQLSGDLVLEKLKPILEDDSKLQIIQNAKFEKRILNRLGVKTHSNFFDTMLASYVRNPSNKHGLKQQSKRVLHKRMTEIEDIIGTGRKQITMDQAPLEQVAPYAAADAEITYMLYDYYDKSLTKNEKEILEDIEFPLVDVLVDIETEGVKIDSDYLAELSVEISKKVEKAQKIIWDLAGDEFNVSSTKQLGEVLFGKLEIDVAKKKTKTGAYSTDAGTLEEILASDAITADQRKVVEAVVDYRTLTKLLSTYVDNLPKLVSKETGRLHSDFNQVVTATGRLSSSNPNMQNIPIRTEEGRKIRKAFIAKDADHVLISADYSQIELRLLAHSAEEKALIEAFKENKDIHRLTAAKIMDKSEDEVTDDDRRVGKTLNFALIYMQGPFSTSKQLGISMKEAKAFITAYFKTFSNIKPYMDSVLENAHEDTYVETLFNRRRYFRNLDSTNKMLQKEEERQAFNAPLQGTAADIIKMAMINLNHELKERDLKSKIILQVHDELVLEVAKTELEEVSKLVKEEMETAVELEVPLLVDLASGANWLDAK